MLQVFKKELLIEILVHKMDELNEIFNISGIIKSRISSDFHGETG